jgi:hypothetical protein
LRRPAVVIGQPLSLGATMDQIRQAIEALAAHTAET